MEIYLISYTLMRLKYLYHMMLVIIIKIIINLINDK